MVSPPTGSACASGGAEPRATVGGDGAARGAPPLTRHAAAPGHVAAGLLSIDALGRSTFKWKIVYVLSREHRLAAGGCRGR
jgi:hypothetical protein